MVAWLCEHVLGEGRVFESEDSSESDMTCRNVEGGTGGNTIGGSEWSDDECCCVVVWLSVVAGGFSAGAGGYPTAQGMGAIGRWRRSAVTRGSWKAFGGSSGSVGMCVM